MWASWGAQVGACWEDQRRTAVAHSGPNWLVSCCWWRTDWSLPVLVTGLWQVKQQDRLYWLIHTLADCDWLHISFIKNSQAFKCRPAYTAAGRAGCLDYNKRSYPGSSGAVGGQRPAEGSCCSGWCRRSRCWPGWACRGGACPYWGWRRPAQTAGGSYCWGCNSWLGDRPSGGGSAGSLK